MDPSAKSAFEQFSCNFVTSNNLSNAPFVSLIRKYRMPISVRISIFSVDILENCQENCMKWVQPYMVYIQMRREKKMVTLNTLFLIHILTE